MAQEWTISPCDSCEAGYKCTGSCDRFKEWFRYSWDMMCFRLRKKWGLKEVKHEVRQAAGQASDH